MAEITRERTGELIQKLFGILAKNPDGLRAREALERLASSVTLTPYEAGNFANGARRFEKIVRFATVDCAKAGWLTKESGIWSLTDAGKAALVKFPDPANLHREVTRLYRVWKSGEVGKTNLVDENKDRTLDSSLEKDATVTFEDVQDQARSEIEEHLLSLNPYDFQGLVADLLEAMGYHVSWNAPPGKDGGVDVIAYPDPLGSTPPRIKVQVKRTGDRINSDGVRAFLALINDGDVGLYVAIGGFTRDAVDLARNQENRKITLIDVERFRTLWIENYSRLKDAARKKFTLSPVYFLTPDD